MEWPTLRVSGTRPRDMLVSVCAALACVAMASVVIPPSDIPDPQQRIGVAVGIFVLAGGAALVLLRYREAGRLRRVGVHTTGVVIWVTELTGGGEDPPDLVVDYDVSFQYLVEDRPMYGQLRGWHDPPRVGESFPIVYDPDHPEVVGSEEG